MDKDKFKEKLIKKYWASVLWSKELKYISTWFIELDNLSWGGIPLWRTSQIYGKPWSWKTTLAMHIAKEFDILWYRIAFVDIEWTYPKDLEETLGIKNMDVFSPTTWEEAVDIIRDCISDWYKLVILDSIWSMSPSYELNTTADQKTVWGLPSLISKLAMMGRYYVWIIWSFQFDDICRRRLYLEEYY